MEVRIRTAHCREPFRALLVIVAQSGKWHVRSPIHYCLCVHLHFATFIHRSPYRIVPARVSVEIKLRCSRRNRTEAEMDEEAETPSPHRDSTSKILTNDNTYTVPEQIPEYNGEDVDQIELEKKLRLKVDLRLCTSRKELIPRM